MARQTGEYKITGTYDDVTYYYMEGNYYARKKSRLKGERVKRAKEFKRTMESARRLATGSQLASKLYRSLPRTAQVYTLFCTLKSAAIKALKEGKSETGVVALLQGLVKSKAVVPLPPVLKKKKSGYAPVVLHFTGLLYRVHRRRDVRRRTDRWMSRRKACRLPSPCNGRERAGPFKHLRRAVQRVRCPTILEFVP